MRKKNGQVGNSSDLWLTDRKKGSLTYKCNWPAIKKSNMYLEKQVHVALPLLLPLLNSHLMGLAGAGCVRQCDGGEYVRGRQAHRLPAFRSGSEEDKGPHEGGDSVARTAEGPLLLPLLLLLLLSLFFIFVDDRIPSPACAIRTRSQASSRQNPNRFLVGSFALRAGPDSVRGA